MADNKIYPFGPDAVPPYIQTDTEYEADAMRVDGWQPGIVRQEFLNKVDRQAITPAAGISQFIADNQALDITDDMTPADYAAAFIDALGNVDIVTQAQFDDSQKIATTQFINRALGSNSGDSDYAINTVLTAAHAGMVISPTVASLTFTLPLASTVRAGTKLYFSGNGEGCTVQRQGSDVIANGEAGNVNSVIVLASDRLELTQVDGVWNVTAGNEQLSTSSQFAHSNGASGYMRLPGGLIIQWGKDTLGITPVVVTFPIVFPTACFSVVATDFGNGCLNVAATTQNATNFTAYAREGYGGPLSICDYNWIAIGH